MAKQSAGRKVGRNVKWCAAYAASGRGQINKAKRLLKVMVRKPCPSADVALKAMSNIHIDRARRELKSEGFLFGERNQQAA